MKFVYLSILTVLLSSCAFNNLFLHPFPLSKEDTFSEYAEEFEDTLTLSFQGNYTPIIRTSNKQVAKLSYKIHNKVFQNSKGDTLHAWLIQPKENYNGTTLYFLHGNAGNVVYNYLLMEPFVKKGFQVFMIDYSGFGFSQGKSKRKNVLRDGQDGLNYLLAQKDIHYHHLLVYGQSLGGHLAAVVGARNQSAIDGLIIEGAFTSHKDIANDRVPVLSRIFVREMYSAKRNIGDFTKPLLIIHSTEDKTIPYAHGERLYELANEPKTLYTIDGRHVYGPLLYADSIAEKMQKMVE